MVPEMAAQEKKHDVTFRIVDALDHPHGGLILRLRVDSGDPPPVRRIKGARWEVRSPEGEARGEVRVVDFAVLGGKVSDQRLAQTRRLDVHVEVLEEAVEPIDLQWRMSGPLSG